MLRLILAITVIFSPLTAFAIVPLPLAGPGCDDDDGDGYVDVPEDCPPGFVRCTWAVTETACNGENACSWDAERNLCLGHEWEYISFIPARWHNRIKEPVELGLGSGLHADRAWQRTTGRFDTVVAVMDSGIRWHERKLQNKLHLNRGELPVPQNSNGTESAGRAAGEVAGCPAADPYDHNKDCVFNVQDYAGDPRVSATASTPIDDPLFSGCFYDSAFNNASALIAVEAFNDILEPGDLICIFSDGVDDDGNGYADDISGWDTLWDDNNPFDDTDFGHGSGEGMDSTGEAGLDSAPGMCPNCSLLSVRVGDSFVVDANNWAEGAIFAVDSGAKVLQSAVGALTNTSFSRVAIEYAYARGIINIMSAADETAQHQNYPGVLEHTEYVHALRYDAENINQSTSFLAFSNCTNFGARLVLSAPSTSCSSGATGVTSGVAGLLASAMADTVEGSGIAPLTGNEIHQIFVNAVDDVSLPTSQPDHAQHDGKKYPSKEGWDLYFGYGRLNARKVVDMALDGQIPPEADILTPRFWTHVDPAAEPIEITGVARASRASSGTWVLEYGVGPQPDDTAVVDPTVWNEIASGSTPAEGVLGTLDASTITGLDPAARIEPYNTVADKGGSDDNYTKALKVNRYTVTLRLRVVDNEGRKGEDRKAIYVHHDDTLKAGFPLHIGASGESSPKMFDLDGDGRFEIVLGDADGAVHAFRADGTELAGWPVRTEPGRVARHPGSRAFTHGADGVAGNGDELSAEVASAIVATVAIADLETDGVPDVVAATLDGQVYAWDATGLLRAGFPVDVGSTRGHDTNRDAFTEVGMFASPVLADLDGDGAHEIIVATLDQRVFALRGDGSLLNGFPVSGPRDAGDPTKPFLRLPYEGNEDGQGRRIVSSPAVGDLDGDGNLEILVGTNEAINEQVSLVHAFSYDRAAERPVAYSADCGDEAAPKRCFPITMVGGYPNALPYAGEGTPGSPVLADLDGDGKLEIGAAAIADFGRIYHHDGFAPLTNGSAYRELKSFASYYGARSNSGQSSSLAMINSGTFGDLDGDGSLDYMLGTAGSDFVDNMLVDGQRADFDHQLSVWNTRTGAMLPGFPQVQEDLQFFLNPIVADVDGDGAAEVINSSATFVIHAFRADGTTPAGWPKFTGHWQIASPALGDTDGDGLLEMAVVTRAGWLFLYDLEGRADGNVQWSSFRHDARNTGNFGTPDPTLALPVPKAPPAADDGGCNCSGSSPVVLAALAASVLLRRRKRS